MDVRTFCELLRQARPASFTDNVLWLRRQRLWTGRGALMRCHERTFVELDARRTLVAECLSYGVP